jgi:hypothetical protein
VLMTHSYEQDREPSFELAGQRGFGHDGIIHRGVLRSDFCSGRPRPGRGRARSDRARSVGRGTGLLHG